MRTILFFLLLINCQNSKGQISLRIATADGAKQSEFTVLGDFGTFIKNLSVLTNDNTIVIDTIGLKKITISHISYCDTILLVADLQPLHEVYLRVKAKTLDPVSIRARENKVDNKLRIKNGKKLYFQLYSGARWYFNINISKYNLTRINALFVDIKNIVKYDTVKVGVYHNEASILNEDPIAKYSIIIDKTLLNNQIEISDFGDLNFYLQDNIFLSIEVRMFQKNKKEIPTVLAFFQNEESIIYIKIKEGFLNKNPMQHFKDNFNAYPKLAYKIIYN